MIEKIAKEFRGAIEICNKTLDFDDAYKGLRHFKKFPLGCCGDTTDFLGSYLNYKGFCGFKYICGKREIKTHAWLQKGCLIVDITADQFNEGQSKVIVTEGSDWHNGFKVCENSCRTPDYTGRGSIDEHYEKFYNKIKLILSSVF